ncbi:bifunctional metallophosphatase/5'-nucleotidase [Candidatus Fermentibacterales bacterium]|nr:bifunctional metallophosphatase/5'-nucleotidase [Candidatus Fermentibacterales bacterium]
MLASRTHLPGIPVARAWLLLLSAALFTSSAGSGIFYLTILHTNDIHGGITPRAASFLNPDFPPMIGGGAHISEYVERVRSDCEEAGEYCLLFDAGDIYQGTPIGNYDAGSFVMEWMNEVGYDLMTLGNHDFDDGADNAIRLADMARFPVVACNFVSAETGSIPDPVQSYVFYDFEGVRIAVIGVATSDTYGLVDASMLEGYLFLNEIETVERYIGEVRQEGADIVILLSHLGQPSDPEVYQQRIFEAWERGEEYEKSFAMNNAELSTLIRGIDLIVSGHIHYGLRQPWVNPVTHTIVVQGYANGTGLCRIRLAIDPETRMLVGYDLPENGEAYVNLLHDEHWFDQEVREMLDSFRDVAEEGMDEVIGEATAEISRGPAEHPVGRLVADAMLWRTGADVSLMNRGGIRAVIPRGPITPRIVYEALPFDEDLYVFELTGAELLEVLETGMKGRRRDMELGGATAIRNQSLEDMAKIEQLLIDGQPVDSAEVYTFVTTGYLASGNVGYDVLITHSAVNTGYSLFESVLDYIREHSPLSPDNDLRVVWTD